MIIFRYVYANREASKVAHVLARRALTSDDFMVWLEEAPYCLLSTNRDT